MEIKDKLCGNALRKVVMLLTHAGNLGMDISGYGFASENPDSGNVYLWLEDYPFCLFIDLSGDDEIKAVCTNPYDGEEHFADSTQVNDLADLYAWTTGLERGLESESDDVL